MTNSNLTRPPIRVESPGDGLLDLFPIATDEATLMTIMTLLFEKHWDKIVFGYLIQGAVFEIRTDVAPKKISLFDGYVTVDFGLWHFHVCIGENKGNAKNPTAPDLMRHRRTSRAELYRRIDPQGAPVSWGFRMFNGKDEAQFTAFLPNPFLSDEMRPVREPDWSKLALWDELSERFLGLPPDPIDRTGKGFFHE